MGSQDGAIVRVEKRRAEEEIFIESISSESEEEKHKLKNKNKKKGRGRLPILDLSYKGLQPLIEKAEACRAKQLRRDHWACWAQ